MRKFCWQYDATVSGGHGGGGEYEVQLGFGWSNGLIMTLLDKYGDKLTAEDYFMPDTVVENMASPPVVSSAGQMLAVFIVFVITIATGLIG